VTIHLRQPDVEQHDLGLVFLSRLERAGSVMNRDGGVSRELKQLRHGVGGIRIVVDDEDLAPPCRLRSRRFRRGRCRLVDRQSHDELAAFTGPRTACLDAAVMQAHEALDERQPDAEPALRAIERATDLRKHVEHALELVGWNTDAGIAHADDDCAPVSARG
jgi:hypothetical protein